MKKLRHHQTEIALRADGLISGTISSKKTVAHVSPGSGKSAMSVIMAKKLLDAGVIQKVAWICPRNSLASQAADGFWDPDFNRVYSARRADNVKPLFRDIRQGRIAYTTTYQAVASKPDLHFNELNKYKYLLILDEPHHIKDDGDWVGAITPIFNNAYHTLLMTGTIERHDQKLLPFIDYDKQGDKFYPRKDIYYSRFEALLEDAIIPIDFSYINGWASFKDDMGTHNIEISQASDGDVSKVIQTFLGKTDYRDQLIQKGMVHWLNHRKIYPSRMIIICATQDMARAITKEIKDKYRITPSLAISDDPASAEVIRAFRKGVGDILITVAIAHEGLDVPDCKHLICLTDIRSIPWLEQAFARVTRVDYTAVSRGIPYEKQKAYIFVPDDPRMQNVVSYLLDEQDRGIKAKTTSTPSSPGIGIIRQSFIPLGATIGDVTTGVLNVDETIERAPPQDEKEIRRKIEALARRRDIIRRLPRGSTNSYIISRFGKPRKVMETRELHKVLSCLHKMMKSGF